MVLIGATTFQKVGSNLRGPKGRSWKPKGVGLVMYEQQPSRGIARIWIIVLESGRTVVCSMLTNINCVIHHFTDHVVETVVPIGRCCTTLLMLSQPLNMPICCEMAKFCLSVMKLLPTCQQHKLVRPLRHRGRDCAVHRRRRLYFDKITVALPSAGWNH